jgi:hypothetical protein
VRGYGTWALSISVVAFAAGVVSVIRRAMHIARHGIGQREHWVGKCMASLLSECYKPCTVRYDSPRRSFANLGPQFLEKVVLSSPGLGVTAACMFPRQP